MDKPKKVALSVSAVVIATLAIVLLMLFQPWTLFTDEPMEDPRAAAAAPAGPF